MPHHYVADQFVVKIASRCNIACKYCYMYFLGDDSALDSPKFMNEETVRALADRLAVHAERSGLSRLSIAFHGGEPLLLGSRRFREYCEYLRSRIPALLNFSVQTNGLLVDEKWIQVFKEFDVLVGISIDGPEDINDVARVDHTGQGTYSRIRTAIDLVRQHHDRGEVRFGGVISVINPRQRPEAYYSWLKNDLQVKSANILLPDADHDNYGVHYDFRISEFAEFLSGLFDEWFDDVDQDRIYIRLFDNLLGRILGNSSDTEALGTGGASAVVVDTDGALQAHDVFRINRTGHRYNLNVHRDEIDSVLSDDLYQSGLSWKFSRGVAPSLPNEVRCSQCPVHHICGGGFVAHRFSAANGYQNHSVYCDALFSLISHAYVRVAAECV